MEKQDKMTSDVAEFELSRFFDMIDVDVRESEMDEEDRSSFKDIKRKLVKAMVDGRLVINEAGEPELTTSDGNKLVFREPDGAALLAMDQKKKNQDMHRVFAFLASITGSNSITFSKMKQRDLRVCLALVSSFLS